MTENLVNPPIEALTQLPDIFLPLLAYDKSVIFRQFFSDIRNGQNFTEQFALDHWDELGTDLQTIPGISQSLRDGGTVYVGDSMTARRGVSMFFRIFGLEPDIEFDKTMKDRPFNNDPDVCFKAPEVLLEKVYDNTTQWASMAAIFGNPERVSVVGRPKLALTYKVIDEYSIAIEEGRQIERPLDKTIYKQALAFLNMLRTDEMRYEHVAGDGEDFCYLVAFGLMNLEDAEAEMSSVTTHESNRVTEIQKAIYQAEHGEKITSADHRVIQAVTMRYGLDKEDFLHPDSVAKSWPMFWEFLAEARKIAA